MEYAVLVTLWNGPSTVSELVVAIYDRLGRVVSPQLLGSQLRMLERFGFIEYREGQSRYRITERGSVYLANTAA